MRLATIAALALVAPAAGRLQKGRPERKRTQLQHTSGRAGEEAYDPFIGLSRGSKKLTPSRKLLKNQKENPDEGWLEGDGWSGPATLPAVPAETTGAPPEATEPACQSIVEIAAGNEDFSTLVAAVTAAGLVDALSGEGPLTVFAPTNDAFAALPEGTVEALLEDPEGALTDILTYHVVAGNVLSTDLETGDVETLNGDTVAVTVSDDGVMINDSNVVAADIVACNGVIHVIDAVLIPPADPEPTTTATPKTTEPACQSIVEIAAGNEDFSTLVAAVTAAGLVDALSGEGPLTVFAPTNDAFAALPEGTVEALLEDPDALGDILTYHVVAGNVLSTDLESGDVETLNGDSVAVTVSDEGVMINDSNVVAADIVACNGVIHVIDAVLIPPAEPEPEPEMSMSMSMSMPEAETCSFCPDGIPDPALVLPTEDGSTCGTAEAYAATLPADDPICPTLKLAEDFCCSATPATLPSCQSIVEIAAGNEDFSTLVAAVTAAGLVDALSGEGPLTVFAPTNDAFAALPEGTVEALLEDPDALTDILTYHVVAGNVLSTDLATGDVETLNGDSVAVTVSEDGVTVNDSNVVAADIVACNGVIHVIDAVLIPPEDPTTTAAPEATTEAPEIVEPTTLPEVPVPTPPSATLPPGWSLPDGWSGSHVGSKPDKGTSSAKSAKSQSAFGKSGKGAKSEADAKAKKTKTLKEPNSKTAKGSAKADKGDSKSGKALVDADAKAQKDSGSKSGKASSGKAHKSTTGSHDDGWTTSSSMP